MDDGQVVTSWPGPPPGVEVDLEAEVRGLRRDLRDLVAILSLPLVWRGRPPARIVENLGEVLASLLRLDFLHIRMAGLDGESSVQRSQGAAAALEPSDLDALVSSLLDDSGSDPASGARAAIPLAPDGGRLRLAAFQPGVDADRWMVAAGSYRPDFPTERERFLLRVTLDQAAVSVETVVLFREAEQASVAKSQFIATMSHELRTPLNAILGYSDLLQLGVPEALSSGAQSHVARIQSSARHLLETIDGILSFSRLEAGQEEPRIEPVDLCDLAREVVKILEPLARGKGLDLQCAVPDGAPPIPTDPFRVRQILFNLAGNAIKFTTRGSVSIELVVAEQAVLRVQDTGPGIPPSEQEHIFEPFRQVEGNLTREAGGTGLGLSVARRLAELLGGSLDVESEVDIGSTFTLRLPADRGSQVTESP